MFDTIDISKERLLEKVSQYQIFKYYCKNFVENKLFSSELRNDSSPSCKIYNNNGNLLYYDCGSGEKYDCFAYIQAKHKTLYNIDLRFNEVLKVIANDFGVIKTINNKKVTPSLNYIGKADTFKGIKTKYSLKKKKREWNRTDTYWQDYNMNRELLDFYRVEPLEYYWKSNPGGYLDLVYDYNNNIFDPAYSYEEINGYRKILRPYAGKLNKWDSSMPKQIVEGYNQLDNTGDYCIITSSRKDTMAWRMFGYNACNPGSETIFLTENCLLLLKSRFKHIVINYDNDEQGIKSMRSYSNGFALPVFIIPKLSASTKDLSDLIYFKGMDVAQNIVNNFKKNLIYGTEF
jgi:hypothetical protein